MTQVVEFKHAHFFCGLGGGARGFNRGQARVGNLEARFRCIGGIDVDPASIRDFERLAGVPGTVMDLFSLEQYIAFHGKAPPPGWREATPTDVQAAFGYEAPDIVFLSAPCKGFSGLLSEKQSKTDKYQALNGLTLRGMMLMCEAFKDCPPKLVIFENVPRLATRGRYLMDQILGLMRGYSYVGQETTHNCGEIGNLAQSRERLLAVFRHEPQVPNFLYEPPKRPLRGVGEILDRMPLPGDVERAGPMHRVPALQFQTWVRLAFVPAGKDWRALNDLRVEDGVLKDFALVPASPWQPSTLGVRRWDEPTGVVPGRSYPTCGAHSVADPRSELWGGGQGGVTGWNEAACAITTARSPLQNKGSVADPRPVQANQTYGQYGVRAWTSHSGAVTGQHLPGGGPNSVADPRPQGAPKFNNILRIVRYDTAAPAVAGPGGPAGGLCVADPRMGEQSYLKTKYQVTAYDDASRTVIGASTTGDGAFAVADPRTGDRRNGALGVHGFGDTTGVVGGESLPPNGAYAVADPREAGRHHGVLGVQRWDAASGVVQGSSRPANGPFSVADPRGPGMAGDLHGKYPVVSYSDPARAVIAGRDNGAFAVADPRPTHGPNAHTNKMKVIDYREACVTVTGSDRVGSGALSVADPRLEEKPRYSNVFRVTAPDEPAPAVTSAKGSLAAVADPRPQGLGRPDHYGVLGWGQTSGTVTASAHGWDNGRFSVADPRPHGLQHKDANSFGNQAHYGVIGWEQHSGSVTAFGQADNGRWSVADRRVDLLPGLKEQLVCLIIALDGTWHRPFTTLELAALQSLYDPEDVLELEGRSDSAWRERIGNAVPSAAAEAIAGVMGTTLLLAMTGETFSLSNDSIWVRQLQIGLSVDLRGQVPA